MRETKHDVAVYSWIKDPFPVGHVIVLNYRVDAFDRCADLCCKIAEARCLRNTTSSTQLEETHEFSLESSKRIKIYLPIQI